MAACSIRRPGPGARGRRDLWSALVLNLAPHARNGLRLALGADRRTVFLLVVGDGMLLVAVGIAFGLTAGGSPAPAGWRLSCTVFRHPTCRRFAATVAILTAVALTACVTPARRAMRVHPIAALRDE